MNATPRQLLFLARFPRPTLWAAYLVVGILAIALCAFLETGSLNQSFVYHAVGASGVLFALIGVWRNRPDRAAPWLLMAFGQGLFVAGDLVWGYYAHVGEEPFPSIADGLYLMGYPFIALGLLLLIRRRLAGGDRGGLLDAAIITTAFSILSWVFLMQPLVAAADIDPLSLGISLAYPLADLLLIGVAMGLLTTPGARTTAFRLLGLSLVVRLVVDQIFAIQTLDESYISGGPVDIMFLVSYVVFGVSALHPSMRRLTDPQPSAVTWLGPVRLIGLAAASITGPLLFAIGINLDANLVIGIGTAVLSILVLVRLAGLVGLLEHDVAVRRALETKLSYQAQHDPLTGLANRRQFVEQAEASLAARQQPGSMAVLFVDLDRFKSVNDSLGHAAGDELLVEISERIRGSLRAGDLAARLGGDEFGVLVYGIDEPDQGTAVALRLLASLELPIAVADQSITIGASIGIAVDRSDTGSVDDLLGDADAAMYQAKALGTGHYKIFTGADPTGAGSSQPERPTVRRPRPGLVRPEAPLPAPTA